MRKESAMNEIDDELEEIDGIEDIEEIEEIDEVEDNDSIEDIGVIEDNEEASELSKNNIQPTDEKKPQEDDEEPKKPFSDLLDWGSSIVYAVALMLVVNLFIFRSITVSGDSMNDTLVNNDKVIATNFFYTPSYGDIVVVQANKLPIQGTDIYGEPIIKRVIATAGDTVRIDYTKGEVYRNGELLSEDYIKELTHLYRYGYMESGKDYVVPENCVFVMGDNRNVSNDSRNLQDVGFIDEDLIIGRAIVRFSPIKDFKWL